MSNYGQQPPYGQNPYGQQPPQPNPYGQQPPVNPYATQPPRPGQPPYGQQPSPYGQPQQPYPPQQQPYAPPQPGQQPYAPPPPGQQPYGQPAAGGQWPAPSVAERPTISQHPVPVVTMDSLPGRDIEEVLGEVVGVVARARELRPDLRGGNIIEGYATMLTESRQEAVARLVEMAERAGATAVVGLRFDCSEITQSLSEVAAYGTAVRLAPLEDEEQAGATDEESGADEETERAAESGSENQAPSDDQSEGRGPSEQRPESSPGSSPQWPPANWPSAT